MEESPDNLKQTPVAAGGRRKRWAWGLTGAALLFTGVAMSLPIQGGSTAGAGVLAKEAPASERLANPAISLPTQTLVSAQGPSIGPAGGVELRQPIGTVMFNGRKLRPVRTIEVLATAYSPDERSCGKSADGITASGMSVWTNGMKMVAADTNVIPMRSIVTVPGYNGGKPVQVLDRGGAIKGNRLDVLFPTHEAARKWGRQKVTLVVWEYAD